MDAGVGRGGMVAPVVAAFVVGAVRTAAAAPACPIARSDLPESFVITLGSSLLLSDITTSCNSPSSTSLPEPVDLSFCLLIISIIDIADSSLSLPVFGIHYLRNKFRSSSIEIRWCGRPRCGSGGPVSSWLLLDLSLISGQPDHAP